ncbi:hypothetical protein BH23GEM7_BH23GEM7_15400 [soil metagenome]
MYGIEGLLAGRTLVDRYRVEEVIGRGGMGAVYLATDQRLGRQVAVKVIAVAAPDPQSHARLRARFHREARAAAGLHHPNIVAVYDFGTDTLLDLDFLVMELLRGEDLATRLGREGPPALPVTLSILYQAARGLAAGHRTGLVHRDVKPGNLFLQSGDRPEEVQVRVLDFGIAEVTADDQTLTHLTVYGRSPFSPAYASPEQLRGESCVTPATDVFSLAAVGYHLLTGERAFTSGDPERMAAELSSALASLPRRPMLRPPLREILQRGLAHRAEDRFRDAGALAEALAPLLAAPDRSTAQPDATRWVGEPRERPAAEPEPKRRFSFFSRKGSRPAPERPVSAYAEPTGTRTAFEPPPPRNLAPRTSAAPPMRTPGPAPAPSPAAAHRPGWFRRAGAAVWSFCVTTVVVGLFMGAWALALTGLESSDPALILGGIAGSIALTPLAVHRVMGRRGSYRLALLGSIAASVASLFLVGPNGEAQLLLATMFGLQLVTALVIVRLTRRAEPRPVPGPQHTPIRA